MKFFKLTHPRYPTDQEDDRRNPVSVAGRYQIPGIVCDVCGNWSSSSRLRGPLPREADQFRHVEFLPPTEWKAMRGRWAAMLGVEPARVQPGLRLGPPTGLRSGPIVEDVVHPFPGLMWVADRVRAVVVEEALSGVSFASVELEPDPGDTALSELVIHGSAWRQGSTEQTVQVCSVCGRRGFPSPRNLKVDEARWDGSDFLHLDGNPNIVVVTQRAAAVFNAHKFSNVTAELIDY